MSLQRLVLAVVLVSGSLCSTRFAHGEERPKLVVVVSVDQLCQEYLQRFGANLNDQGFYRMVEKQGAHYANCHHSHAFTHTGPGHSGQMTGAHPNMHGIIGNIWFDRASGKNLYCVADPAETTIGATDIQGPCSPKNMLATTVGDMLKLSTDRQGKVFGVALKDRAAILMTGRLADAAYWFEEREGVWVTSSYYRQDRDLPGYIRAFNTNHYADRFAGQEWKLLYDDACYHHDEPDDYAAENPPSELGRTFPHKLAPAGKTLYAQLRSTPMGNDMTLDVAREVIVHEQLGEDAIPDLLCVNLSSNDYAGHAYGPHSLEVEDITYRTDLQLRAFHDWLADHLQHQNFVLIVTSDHGVCPLPELMKEKGLIAGRDPLGNDSEVAVKLEAVLRDKLALEKMPVSKLVQFVEPNQVYFDHSTLAGEELRAARVLTRDWLISQPGVFCAATYDELLSGRVGGPFGDALVKSFHPHRSGDVLWIFDPYFISGDKGTTHGSPWSYDTHVPLLLVGQGIAPGKHHERVCPAAIAPTVAELLGIEAPPSCFEEPLAKALKNH